MPRLTQGQVDKIELDPERRITVWDDVLKGFGVRVTPNGRKSFVVCYRPQATRKFTWFTLGRPPILSAAEARRRAGAALALVAAGGDPADAKSSRLAVDSAAARHHDRCMTLAEFAPLYMRDHARKEKKPRSAKEDQANLDRFLIPAFGERPLEQITTVEIATLHAKIGDTTPVQANRVLALISVLFSKAVKWKVLPADYENPASEVQPYTERARKRFLNVDELGRVGAALDAVECEADAPPKWGNQNFSRDRRDAIAIIRLIFFAGCRKMEIVSLKKTYIDREFGKLRLPDSKGGPKDIALSSHALAVLDAVEVRGSNAGSEWVFPGRDASVHRSEPRRIWQEIRERAGVSDVTLHDIRRTYASLAANANTPPSVLQGLLGHARFSTTEKYVQPFDRSRDLSAERVSALTAEALARHPTEPA
jgi:integrase